MKKQIFVFGLAVQACVASLAGSYTVVSPDKLVRINVNTGKELTWSVERAGETIVCPSPLSLDIEGATVQPGKSPRVVKAQRRSVDETVIAEVPTKFRNVRERYNELVLRMKGGYSVEFRAYDNGAAYRFVTAFPGTMTVNTENVAFCMPDSTVAYWPMDASTNFVTPQEAVFERRKLDTLNGMMKGYLPIYMQTPAGTRAVITEAGVEDYSNLFLTADSCSTLRGEFPKVIREKRLKPGSDRNEELISLYPYIARTSGTRALPWRIVMLSPDDAGLLENYLAWQLSGPSVIGDASWIKPGQISWDWWSNMNLYGVDFEAGANMDTYRYYIDFAAEHNIEYILLDEGWSKGTWDITHYKPEINVEELVRYGNERGVGIILWALWNPLEKDIEGTLDVYRDWGVKGIKIDFMDRSDQDMVNFYDHVGKAAAERHLMVDFHGAYKPCGMQRKYPNVMTFEGVMGMEYHKCPERAVTPMHNLTLPFIRNLAGPMDYTPGAVNTANQEDYLPNWTHPMALGTRAHQAAIFVVFESPLQMVCDSPSNYNLAPGYADFLGDIPTVWDETVAIDAAIGEHLVMARRNGENWFIGAMTDWTPRDMEVVLDFLPTGKWNLRTFADGRNAHRQATDYKIEETTVSSGDTVRFHMAPGGGWAAILTPAK
ncbi:MAG: glycoside hydrolase family 97 protein [Muribaculaceae bacterium]|nr:glycoside hydrolase family 97 protein [Muribaculaceae bacterium]